MKKYSLILFLSICVSQLHAQNNLRTVEDLTSDTSAWPLLLKDIAQARNKVEILPIIKNQNKDAIYKIQVTTHSYMGAIVYFTGGLLIDNGWIRILGSGSAKLKRTLPGWNKGKSFKDFGEKPPFLLVGDDAAGGFFAINGGEFGKDLGKIYYLAPEKLNWDALNITYSEFLNFCFVGDIGQFYDSLKWKGWEKDLKKLNGDQTFYFYPFLWTKEGKDVNSLKRTIVPVQEQYVFKMDSMTQLKN